MSLMLNSSQGLRSGVWKGEIFRLCEGREWRSWREETIALVPSLSVMELDSDSYSIAWDSITAGYAYLWYTLRAELPTSESSPAESKIEIKVPTSDSRAKPFCPIAWSSVKEALLFFSSESNFFFLKRAYSCTTPSSKNLFATPLCLQGHSRFFTPPLA